jgi:REP element-mobilizing transposase RayT
MANTYSQLFYHVVFSTKRRLDLIDHEIEERVWNYMGGIARKHDITSIRIGGIDNHIHGLVMAKPIVPPCKIPMWLKGGSSKWIHDEFVGLGHSGWQDGYGVFSVSKSQVPEVVRYIENQRQHHQCQTFEEEYVSLLNLHGIEYDERFVFD